MDYALKKLVLPQTENQPERITEKKTLGNF